MVTIGKVSAGFHYGCKQRVSSRCWMIVDGRHVRGGCAHRTSDVSITDGSAARPTLRIRGQMSLAVVELERSYQGRIQSYGVEAISPIFSHLLHCLIAKAIHHIQISSERLPRLNKRLGAISMNVASGLS